MVTKTPGYINLISPPQCCHFSKFDVAVQKSCEKNSFAEWFLSQTIIALPLPLHIPYL